MTNGTGRLTIDAQMIVDATEKAFKLGRQTYLPKSQVRVIEGGEEVLGGRWKFEGRVVLEMPHWLAEAKSLVVEGYYEVIEQQERVERAASDIRRLVASRPDDGLPAVAAIHDGRYTVVDAGGKTHRTLLLRINEEAGKQMVAVIRDGRTEGVGWLIDGRVTYWRRSSWLSDAGRRELHEDLLVVAGNPLGAMEQYALRSNRCSLCDAELTHPDSIRRFMGPVCSKKWDKWYDSQHRRAAA
jgi:acyl-CoA synthetase (AMP-forming)/AMP-acid ligase II